MRSPRAARRPSPTPRRCSAFSASERRSFRPKCSRRSCPLSAHVPRYTQRLRGSSSSRRRASWPCRRSRRRSRSRRTGARSCRSRVPSSVSSGSCHSCSRSAAVPARRSTRSASCRARSGCSSGRRSWDRSSALPSGSSLSAADSKKSSEERLDLVSHSSLHTERIGERLARLARPGDVLALWGELGAGKTVLAKGVAAGLGLDPGDVASPTFIILREHYGGRMPFFHLDLYRLEGQDLGSTGWEETLDGGGITVIEWPDRAGDALPTDRLDVHLEHIADTKRRVLLEPTGARSRELLRGFHDSLGA
ncbi:MAG: tRNA (adenosine(37)-N6)-threonylcarbamoyltransferase complex ATPase subunit type 1 TsaE [Chloroflexi bacterium]|nr:MAG: tRNA (adenosine(37)-N6)-threonylcarbamoyltransferase complex ATPase subunit type 1 TsaE [Chloroflexota bacterium]